MVYTKTSLIHILLSSGISSNNIITYLEVILILRKKYGNSIYSPTVIHLIEKKEPGIASLIRLLYKYNITHIHAIKHLCESIKKQTKDYILQFNVFVPQEKYFAPIQQYLQKKFPQSETKKYINLDIGIQIHGEGWYYKRNFNQDIEKLLG